MSEYVDREHCEVIVVGAGVAGLVAALTLAEAGRSVVCLEARNRVGGRARSITTVDGVVDLGATWFWPGEPLVTSLLARLGIESFPQEIAGDAIFEAGSRVRRLTGNPIDAAAYRFSRGAQSLPARIAEELPAGTVRVDSLVRAVQVGAEGVQVESVQVGAWTHSLTADQVVIAVPPALAVDSITFTPELPAELRRVATGTSVWMGGVVKAVAGYDEPFWRARGLAGAAISYDGPFQEIHDHSGPDGRPAALFGFAPAQRFIGQDSTSIGVQFRAQLRRLFGAEAEQIRRVEVVDWSTEEFTVPAWTSPTASTAAYGHPVFQQITHGRIRWASTETATSSAGHLEGAIAAGLHAARSILASHTTTIGAD